MNTSPMFSKAGFGDVSETHSRGSEEANLSISAAIFADRWEMVREEGAKHLDELEGEEGPDGPEEEMSCSPKPR